MKIRGCNRSSTSGLRAGAWRVLDFWVLLSMWVLLFGALANAAYATSDAPPEGKLADTEVRLFIEYQLIEDPAIPAHLVDVEVKDRIATLSGSIDNLLAKERATEVARTVRGVRSVINNVSVHAPERPAEELKNEVQKALAADPATDLYESGVHVSNGTVVLTGSVDSLAEREVAGQVAKSIKGVSAVKNDMTVKPQLQRSAEQIETDVKALLRKNPWVDADAVKVAVKDSTVRLSGSVGSAIEKTYAANAAWVPGVLHVDAANLNVDSERVARTTEPLSDTQVEQLIEHALKLHPRLSSFTTEVQSDNHIVTLTGSVDNFKAKKTAGKIAADTTGVTQVRNLIKVRPEKIPDAAALSQAVRDALLRDAYVSRYDFNVWASNAKVYLDGRVDSEFEKNHAKDVASRVHGVADIKNNLEVVDLEIPQKTDWELQQDIATALRWNPFVNEDHVAVSVEHSIATLKGGVNSWQEKIAATRSAQRAGAESVLNQLEVRHARSGSQS